MAALRSRVTTHGRNAAGARALWRATGMGDDDFGKAVVVDGVAQAPTDLITAISATASEAVDEAGLTEVERSACPTCGSCSGMFTANSKP